MEFIQSKDNQIIRDAKKLKEKKFRSDSKAFLVEGFRFVEEAIKSCFEVTTIFLDENEMERWNTFNLDALLQKTTVVYSVPTAVLKQLAATENPQGIIAIVKYKFIPPTSSNGFYVLVDKVQDPGNLGTIIRTAHATKALGVILSEGTVDVFNEKTLRATMGSVFHVPLVFDNKYESVIQLQKDGFKIIGTSLDSNANFYNLDLTRKFIFAVGNEGAGVSRELLNIADYKVAIPMPGGAESLNVAVAASVMMYEVVRQLLK